MFERVFKDHPIREQISDEVVGALIGLWERKRPITRRMLGDLHDDLVIRGASLEDIHFFAYRDKRKRSTLTMEWLIRWKKRYSDWEVAYEIDRDGWVLTDARVSTPIQGETWD